MTGKRLLEEIKWLILIGGMPPFFFTLAVLFSFLVYPYDADSAGKVIFILTSTGVLVGLFLLVHHIRQLLKR